MKDLTAEQAIDELAEGEAIQAELVGQRMTLEWGQRLFTQLVNTWTVLDTYETLAYEDKVAVQMRVLDEATVSLWHLHKRLLQANRMLKGHRKQLGRLKNPLIL
jgi:arginine deiminase